VDEGGHARLEGFELYVLSSESGAYRWSAPELLVEDDVPRKPPSDVYSFGCVCLEVLINRFAG
jgi:serine/threonine protein kinase